MISLYWSQLQRLIGGVAPTLSPFFGSATQTWGSSAPTFGATN